MSKKVAVLHAQIPFARGGAELMVEGLVRELKKREFDTELVSIPFRWYPQNGLYNSLLMWRLLDLREINGEKIDLVIPTKFPTYGIIHENKKIWLMHQHRAAYDLYMNKDHFGLGTIEHGAETANKIRRYDEVTLSESKSIYTISNNVALRLKQYNNLMGTPLYHPPALVGRYCCERYDDYILFVGRLDPLKRVDLLIRALSENYNKNIKAVIVGKGPELEKLQGLSKELQVDDRVDFLGRVSDEELLSIYANAGCVYYAPVDEDYGYVTLESFLSRKPVITCKDSGGVLEFVDNDRNGKVCDTEPNSIAKAIDELFENRSSMELYGEAGFETVKDISWENVIRELTRD